MNTRGKNKNYNWYSN